MPASKRIPSIDIVRGLVMVIMALDHTRDFLHVSSITQSPTDLTTTTPLLFFTRWITHLCAPIFVFLAGTSAFLSLKNSSDPAAGRRFLLTRGLWLVILEITLVNFGLWFDIQFRGIILEVIAAIGLSFIVLGLLVKLPAKTIGVIGLVLIFGHDLYLVVPFPEHSLVKQILAPLFNLTIYPVSRRFNLLIGYPLIPWLGILLAGYGCGPLFALPVERRKKIFLRAGLTVLAGFILLRYANIYGDPSKWTVQKNGLFTFLSFLNTTKYPVSLLFTLMILGIMFLLFVSAESAGKRTGNILTVYGRVPLFYFLIHLYLIHCIMLLMVYLQGHWGDLSFGPFSNGRPKTGTGISLGAVYLIWISVVIALYPVCRWYGHYKFAHREKPWLRYL